MRAGPSSEVGLFFYLESCLFSLPNHRKTMMRVKRVALCDMVVVQVVLLLFSLFAPFGHVKITRAIQQWQNTTQRSEFSKEVSSHQEKASIGSTVPNAVGWVQ